MHEIFVEIVGPEPYRVDAGRVKPAAELIEQHAYWSVSLPDVLIHIYTPGDMPDEAERDRMNAVAADFWRSVDKSQFGPQS